MRERLRVAIRGAVQGVGFRPFVYRLASELALDGWVVNSPQGVLIELEGDREALEQVLPRLLAERPPRAVIHSLEPAWLDPVPYRGFEIRESRRDGSTITVVLPDIATCDECRAEIVDPANRRYRYPFTNCTNCGPRFTIIEGLPYDRPQTSMRAFEMCPACREEYENPRDRRFHAQPNACPVCGPRLEFWDPSGRAITAGDDALRLAVAALRVGLIVAVKGLGGFHLMVDAANARAVMRLRRRKRREEKPFAVMYPNLRDVERDAVVTAPEARLLLSPEAPIVLVGRRGRSTSHIAAGVAPGNPYLGVMIPYTPLHHLLLADLGRAVVATSGNLSDEPICTDEVEALDRLGDIADVFLVHDRRIVRHVDDSIVRVMLGRELVIRRARGYAPLPVCLSAPTPPLVAVGGHLKDTVAVSAGRNVFISQHIGDLETQQATDAFLEVMSSVQTLYQTSPIAVVADLHPDYLSTKHARSLGLPVLQVQHHFAHVASCMAENDLAGAVLGVAWDGTGYGTDGTVWGGEFLVTEADAFTRVACLRPFRLPGGDSAIREPRRSALGVLYAMFANEAGSVNALPNAFTPAEQRLLLQALARGVNSPVTTSAGRLFDAVAALTGLRQRSTFEGQAAFELECAIDEATRDRYPFAIETDAVRFRIDPAWDAPPFVVDWAPVMLGVLRDVALGTDPGVIAAKFHLTLASAIVGVARRVGEPRVVLTGGCFQNRALTESTVDALRAAGFRVYWHQRVPPNDGGLALGQIAAAVRPAALARLGVASDAVA